MRKISLFLGTLGIIGLVLPYSVVAQTPSPATQIYSTVTRICPYDKLLQTGASGDEVKALQSLLAEDSSVYPEGLKTGYYGRLTLEAVKRLQRKFGLSETGELDNDTRDVIFPCVTLRVASPNGGEVWKVGETHEITWEVNAPVYILEPLATTGGKLRETTLAPGAVPPSNAVRPFYPHLSIDLVRTDSPAILREGSAAAYGGQVVFHIGGASLYGDRSFKWTIPQSILESRAYKVRISVWKYAPDPIFCNKFEQPCPLAPQAYPIVWRGYLWDESDSEFAVLGGKPETSPTPFPLPTPDYSKLKQLYQQLSDAVLGLQKALRILEEILNAPR